MAAARRYAEGLAGLPHGRLQGGRYDGSHVYHLLVLFTPRPMRFFGWVVSLAALAAMLAPFTTSQSTASKVATAVLNLVLGIAIGSLVSGDGQSNWYKGVQLITVYAIIALMFYLIPVLPS